MHLRRDGMLPCERVEAYLSQKQPGVLGRGGGGHLDAGVLDRDDEPQRVRIGRELAGLDQLDHHRLLALGVSLDPLIGIGHLEVVQRRASTAHARLAGHHRLVELRREALRRPGRPLPDVLPV
jgi:hypothetical protein